MRKAKFPKEVEREHAAPVAEDEPVVFDATDLWKKFDSGQGLTDEELRRLFSRAEDLSYWLLERGEAYSILRRLIQPDLERLMSMLDARGMH